MLLNKKEAITQRVEPQASGDAGRQRAWLAKPDATCLALLLAVGLVIRLAWVLHLPADERSLSALPDQVEYLQLGRHCLTTGTLAFHDARFDQEIYAYRTPGYPCLIAVCGGSIRIVRIVQALIDTSSIFAVFLLARTWIEDWRVWIAAAMVAFNPWLIYFSGLLLGETLFAALLVWGMVLVRRRQRVVACAILVAGVFVRPSAILLPTVLAISSPLPLILERVRRRVISNSDHRLSSKSPSPHPCSGLPGERGRNRFLVGTFALLFTVAALLPWAIRNHARLGAWIWLTTNGGITLYDGFNPSADGGSDQAFVGSTRNLSGMDEVQRDRVFQQKAIEFIQSHPATAIRLVIVKILRTWSPFPLSESYRSDVRYVAVGAAYAIPLFVLTIIGLWRGSLTASQRVFLLMPAIYITIMHGVTIGSLRYRIPADIPMAVIAASGWRATNRLSPPRVSAVI